MERRHRLRREILLPGRRHQAGPPGGHPAGRERLPRREAEGRSGPHGRGRPQGRQGLRVHRRVPGPHPGLLLRPLRLPPRAAAGPGHERQGRRPDPGHRQEGAGGRVPGAGGEDRPRAPRREIPPGGPVHGRRQPAGDQINRRGCVGAAALGGPL